MRRPAILKVSAGFHIVARKRRLFGEDAATQQRSILAQIAYGRLHKAFIEADVVDRETGLQVMTSLPNTAGAGITSRLLLPAANGKPGFQNNCPG